MKVGIIGAGRIGLALKNILSLNHEVKTWDNDPAQNPAGAALAEVVAGADFLFLCVPSWSLRLASENIKSYLEPKTVIISLAKGLEEDSLKTTDAVLAESLPPGQTFFIMGGPLLAENLNSHGLGFGVAASVDKTAYPEIIELFKDTNIVLEYSKTPAAVAWAGVLKNIYATLIGVADGLNWSENAKGWLIAQSVSEMAMTADKLGLPANTIISTAGLGDFIATGFCQKSNNRSCGESIAKNGTVPTKKNEGLNSAPLLAKLLEDKAGDFKLLKALNNIIASPQNAKDILETIIKLQL